MDVSRLLGSLCNIGENNRSTCHLQSACNSSHGGELPWEKFALKFVLRACGHHIGAVILHLFFLTLWSGCFVWRNKLTSSGGANNDSSKNRKSLSQKPDLRLAYKATLGACVCLLVLNWVIAGWVLLFGWFQGWQKYPVLIASAAVTQGIAWLVISLLTKNSSGANRERYPGLLRAWWILSFIWSLSALPRYYVLPDSNNFFSLTGLWDATSCVAEGYLFLMAVRGSTGFRQANDGLQEPLLNGHKYEKCGKQRVTDYSKTSFIGSATISWLNPLLAVGRRKHLELKDIPLLIPRDRAEASFSAFSASWNKLKEDKPSSPPSLAKALVKSFWREAVWTGAFAAINSCATYVGPYLIVDFVNYLGGKRRFRYEGYVLVISLFGSKFIETLAQRQWQFGTQVLGLHIRSALTAFVYRKGLSLSSRSRMSHATGEIINYMAVDVERVGEFSWYLHDIWVLPLQVLLALAILYKTVGLAAIATFVATGITLLINQPVANISEGFQDKLMEAKDERMKALSEALRSMRILKLQAWERRYLEKLEYLRKIECDWLAKALYAAAASTFIFWSAPMFVAASTFGTCVFLGVPLTAGRILSAIATFRALQSPLDGFPDLVTVMAQTKVSLDRLKSFLQEEELPLDDVIHLSYEEAGLDGEDEDYSSLEIEGGNFSWDPSAEVATLRHINMHISRGACVAICGTVGSGKSSLLSCILGEIPKITGTVKVTGTTAYVAQSPWIQSGTIEDNIRFGSPMEYMRYKNVLRVCALEKDLELLAFGDQTQIGERGINLSGGQKQRVQLARAVYQDADVYLLDDPFSAVDAHTGSYLFKECVLMTLASKTVIYVTHQVDFLPAADIILVMRDGEIVQAGQYEDLLQAGTDFSTLVGAHNEALESMDVNGYLRQDELEMGFPDDCDDLDGDDDSDTLSTTDSEQTITEYIDKEETGGDKPRQLVEDEQRETGSVRYEVYWTYLTSVSHGAYIPVIILVQVLFQVLQIGSSYWMAWATPAVAGEEQKVNNLTLILVYVSLAFGSSIFVFCRAMLVSFVGLLTAQKYFLNMLRNIFRAPMAFFDSTPTGRILSRASSDQSVLDLNMHFRFSGMMVASVQLVGVIAVMSQVTWEVLILFAPVVAICICIQRYYMASARELSRLVGIQKSPIVHHYSESIYGAATIRGFGQEQRFMKTNLKLFDRYARPFFHNFSAIEWLIIRMEILSTFVFASSMMIVIMFPPGIIDPSMAGLAVTYGLQLNAMQSRWVWNLCNVENKIISVERIQQFTKLPSEAPLEIEGCRPPKNWPIYGTIKLQHLQVRYSEHSPLVLHGITCTFPGGKKIGVVGRTGSGKSTLIQAIFRMVEPAGGKILIDGVDITTIGLHDLRSRLSIIPQDPTLFEGTIRGNLDPMEEHSDAEIWEALDKCQLGDVVRGKEEKLEASVSENGENWSVGQRQLLCMGRALLKRTRILVLDEATASVDSATDGVIQRTIRSEFAACTVVTVAHRIPTVVDSDYVLVLSDGLVAEYDAPMRLLEDKCTYFSRLVREYSFKSF
ncbi:ATP-binding cassette, subfamily C (CFTR/MRP), member 2 [Marchantia polymorpha subsp. ruderalis]|uniref:Uncharacterized protein n=2 Tax=Marchantia polymorpha TaxID=3197 RepID=A0AAF6B8Z7_MARPO|nr:hypothetical protein MARPO_0011s0178 [Marchantia polymorpha]BBN08481.1 hypothetical protein Mp_4g11930 [Marchantia polymorpha subsp. ruderalis]|eukprot:PTQ46518.1 hypothetical protein MARPO_0011s0178 [Marchantia polymorpha]